jgi:hypothetical protein
MKKTTRECEEKRAKKAKVPTAKEKARIPTFPSLLAS